MLSQYLTDEIRPRMADIFPKCGDGYWKTLPEAKREEIIRGGEKYLNYSWPMLPASLFIAIVRDGNRQNYETLYFARREALSSLALAETVENRGRFLDDIMNGIFCICEESNWVLPAHNTYVRDTPQLPLPVSDRPILDLFACETGAILACVHYLLGDQLKAHAEEITARIERELQRRIIEPYLHEFFWFMGNDICGTNNWTVWCTKNVLLTAFLLPRDEETWKGVLRQAVRSTDCFIKDYGDDGGCSEGASYYHHAALCMFECIDTLNAVTGDAFAAVYREEKIKNIANYIMKVHVSGEYFLNYADCDLRSGLAGVREFMFAKATGQEDMMLFASEQMNLEKNPDIKYEESRNIYDKLQAILHGDEARAYAGRHAAEAQDAGKKGFKKLVSLPSVGISAAEGKKLYLSVKSGTNCGSHKHNDVGSFIVFAKGEPLLIDVGVETYSRKTFTEQRYEIWTMQSSYHNLPAICGHGQVGKLQDIPGRYMAEDVRVETRELPQGGALFTEEMELKGTFEEDTPIDSYRRFWRFEPEGEIEVRDLICFSGERSDWVLSFMTEQEPHFDEESGELVIGDRGVIRFSAPCSAQVEAIPITDERMKRSWKGAVYRTRVVPQAADFSYRIAALE